MKKSVFIFLIILAASVLFSCGKKEVSAKNNSDEDNAKAALETTKDEDSSKTINGIEAVFVKGGTFIMGSPRDEQGRRGDEVQHKVTLTNDFYIGKYPITNAQYADFLNAKEIKECGSFNGKRLVSRSRGLTYDNDVKWRATEGFENRPVVRVDWLGAIKFSRWAGGRLPTEAEWEFAARGGNRSQGYIYSGSDNIDEVAWYRGNSNRRMQSLGQKKANELGIYDMSGGIWEWCHSWYGDYPVNAVTNPAGPRSGSRRVVRGGSWNFGAEDCRVARRMSYLPSTNGGDLGFRVVFNSQDNIVESEEKKEE